VRILHLIWAFPVGGAETMLVELINKQCLNAKITLIIINNNLNNNLLSNINKSVAIIKINRPTHSKNILYFLKLWFIVFSSNAQIVHCHNENLCKLLPGIGKKKLLTIHAVTFVSKYLKQYDQVFAISKSIKDYIFIETKIDATLIYNGINTKSIKIKKDFDFKCFKIIQISRLDYKVKGQDTLIKALEKLVYDFGFNNIQLDFFGGGHSLGFLKNLVNSCKLERQVNFKGETEKEVIYESICEYNLLIQPSRNEGFGLTIVEGMAAKVPVLVSNIDGPIELVQNGEYGCTFNSGDYYDCAKNIYEIITNYSYYSSFERLERIREYTVSNYDISFTAKKYLEEYKNQINARS
jgi:glycosyltransferase involved in cell wall biosynthesis